MREIDLVSINLNQKNEMPSATLESSDDAIVVSNLQAVDLNPTIIEKPFFDSPVTTTKIAKSISLSLPRVIRLVNNSGLEVKKEGKLISAESANKIVSLLSGVEGRRSNASDWKGSDHQDHEVTVTAYEIRKMANVDTKTLIRIVSENSADEDHTITPDSNGRYNIDDVRLICSWVDNWKRRNTSKQLSEYFRDGTEAAG